MWPMLLDMTKDECKRVLRRLELEAYSAIVTAFRAQGDLSKEKKKILQDLSSVLSISMERHRAEIRRAVNDERLTTIADHMVGPNTSAEWAIEGRRLIPLMPRLVPQTAFTPIANQAANQAAAQNAQMPPPALTGNRFSESLTNVSAASPVSNATPVATPTPSMSPCSNVPVLPKQSQSPQPSSPLRNNILNTVDVNGNASSVVILSNDVSPNPNEPVQDDDRNRKRRRSTSNEICNISKPSVTLPIQNQTPSSTSSSTIPLSMLPSKPSTIITTNTATPRTVSIPMGGTPVKITLAPTSQKLTSTMTTPTQKVILVSGSTLNSSLLQRSLNVPIVKTVTATGTTISVTQPKTTSLIMPGNSSQTLPSLTSNSLSIAANGGLGNIVTVATSTASTSSTPVPTTTVSVGGTVTTAFMAGNAFAINKQRQRQKAKHGIVIPMSSHAGSPITQNIQIKPVAMAKPGSQLKNEGALKIITQNLPLSGNAKILPKPSTTSSGTPIVVVTSPSSITVVTKTLSSVSDAAQAGTRVVNVITSQAGRLTGPTSLHKASGSSPAIVTMNPRSLQAATVKVAAACRYPGTLAVDSNNSTNATPALIMVGSKTLQTTTVKVVPSAKSVAGNSPLMRSGSSVTKPNVIVVQKAQVMPPSSIGNSLGIVSSSNSSSQTIIKPMSTISSSNQYDKDVLNFIQRQEKMKTVTVQSLAHSSNPAAISSSPSVNNGLGSANVLSTQQSSTTTLESQMRPTRSTATVPSVQHILTPVDSTTSNVVLVEVSGQIPNENDNEVNDQKNTVLADILQATGILPESIPQSVSLLPSQTSSVGSISRPTNEDDTSQDSSETQHPESSSTAPTETSSSGQLYQLNEWIHLDREAGPPTSQPEGFATFVELPENKESSEESRSQTVNVLPFELQDNQLLEIQAATDILNQPGKHGCTDSAFTILHSSAIDLAKPLSDSVSSEKHQNKTVQETQCGSVGSAEENKQSSLNVEDTASGDSVSVTSVRTFSSQPPVDSLKVSSINSIRKPNLRSLAVNNATPSESGEMMGELDPQTGIFYPLPKSQEGKNKGAGIDLPMNKTELTATKGDVLVNIDESGTVSRANSLDIFSTAIATAQLDLNPFQFIEDDLLHLQESVVSQTASNVEAEAPSLANDSSENKHTSEIEVQSSSEKAISTVCDESVDSVETTSVTHLGMKPREETKSLENVSFSVQTNGSEMEIQMPILSSTSNVQENQLKVPIANGLKSEALLSNGEGNVQAVEVNSTQGEDGTCMIDRHQSIVELEEESNPDRTYHYDNQHNKSDTVLTTNVMVEPSHLDVTTMTMEDFTSQQVDGEDFVHQVGNEVVLDAVSTIHLKDEHQITGEIAKTDECDGTSNGNAMLSDVVAEELQEDQCHVTKDTNENTMEVSHESQGEGIIRSSKRKRKAPPLPDESPPHLTGWLRSAMGILQRVSSYRGKNRAKGDLNASHWFLRPVSPSVAPGYLQIIKQPMDFSTIKKKLETGCYKEMAEFNADMILIKSNCELYNPPEHPARIDCMDVFNFYQQEYDRITEKWQKARIYVPSPKKPKPT